MQKNTVTLAQVGNVIYNLPSNTVKGYSPDNELALIVHKDPAGDGWNITHKSGWAVILHCRTREIALIIAEELGWLANWHNITTENAADWYKVNKTDFDEFRHIARRSRVEFVRDDIKYWNEKRKELKSL